MIISDVFQAGENLKAQKTRTLLTALGIVFGVGSVIGMLAIGAGAREESLSFIEQLGVRNVLVDSRPASTFEELQQRRRASPGLTERDVRVLEANIAGLELITPRRTMRPSRVLPKPARETPDLYGVQPAYATIHNLRTTESRFFTAADEARSAPVCVLGQNAKADILGYAPAAGKFVKLNDTWLEVVGVLGETLASTGQTRGGRMEDLNNVIYIPFNTFQYRLKPGADSIEVAKTVTAVRNSIHNNTQDFTVTIPAALLTQQQRTQTIFTYVMVAIAAISLLVGGIGIMNIVLATVLERTREIGVRRAIGARRREIVRQFLTESVLISATGGLLGRLRLPLSLADLAHRGVENHRHPGVGGDRLQRLGSGRRGLRHLPGDEGLTREPDLRRAIGARRREIVRPFLTESVLISTTGGLLEDHRHPGVGRDRVQRLGSRPRGLRHLPGDESVAREPD